MTEKPKHIIIENGKKRKCPFCGVQYAIENKETQQAIYKNVDFIFIDKAKSIETIKCKHCSNIVAINT